MTQFKVLSPEEIAEVLKKAGHYKASFYVGGEEESIAKEAQKDTLRQVVEMLDGIENPYPYDEHWTIAGYKKRAFDEAIQTIKQALKEEV